MIKDLVVEKAIELADCIKELEEYKEFLKNEEKLKNDEIAQRMLLEFQRKQQDFVMKQMAGEFDQKLLNDLTDLQAKLNARESVVRFIESYNKLLSVIGEILEIIGDRIDLDLEEVYKH